MTNRCWMVVCLSLWLAMGDGLRMMADTVYYVHGTDGSIKAFPAALLKAAPAVSDGGSLSLTLTDGSSVTFDRDSYASWSTDAPHLPGFASFKFNNKYNPHLHRDVEATADELLGDTLHLVLGAIGKRLVPSFKTEGVAASVTADGMVAISKESCLRFDHDVRFHIVGRGNVVLTRGADGRCVYEPLGRTVVVRTRWLTDDPHAVPCVDIRIDGGEWVTSKESYLHATFSIAGNGAYDDMPAHDVWIKGRGNTSWGWPKKPYRLKFDEKVSPFGLTAGRSWVLLSNYQTGSLFANALALHTGQLVDAVACNHIVPVELYVNGDYQGNYMFTEKVGFGHNSVDGDEETGYMVELSVEYDAAHRFRTQAYDLPVNVKEPSFDGWTAARTEERMAEIEADFNRFTTALQGRTDEVEELLDPQACARFMLVNDLNMNRESNHPKSTFLFKADVHDMDSRIVFGPLWDFDWCYGYPTSFTYFDHMQREEWVNAEWELTGSHFFGDLKRLGVIQRYYYREWTNFVEADGVRRLQEFVQDYYDFARLSFEHDAQRWGKSVSYPELVTKAQRWLATRADYIYSHLTPYDLSLFDTAVEGDVDGSGAVTVTDAYLTFCHVMGDEPEGFDAVRADVNYDKCVDMADVVCIVRRILTPAGQAAPPVGRRPRTSTARLRAGDFMLGAGESAEVSVCLAADDDDAVGGEEIDALQFDVRLPDGLELAGVEIGGGLAGHALTAHPVREGLTRVVVLPTAADASLAAMRGRELLTLTLRAVDIVPAGERKVWLTHGIVTGADGEEKRLPTVSIAFEETTGLDPSAPTMHIGGGSMLHITSLEEDEVEVMAVGGVCVRRLHVVPGENTVELPDGVYVVKGRKVIICR